MGEILGRVMTVAGSQITVNPEAETGRAPDPANRPRSDQTTHREGRPQSRRPNPEPATSCYYWSWRGLHRPTTPGSVWVSAPGDYPTFNSNHTPDGTTGDPIPVWSKQLPNNLCLRPGSRVNHIFDR